jgi:hypothetical protein
MHCDDDAVSSLRVIRSVNLFWQDEGRSELIESFSQCFSMSLGILIELIVHLVEGCELLARICSCARALDFNLSILFRTNEGRAAFD